MKSKILKKSVIALTLSIVVLNMIGCESINKLDDSHNVNSSKIYTSLEIKDEVKNSLKKIFFESINITKEFLSDKDLSKDDFSKLNKLSNTIKGDRDIFEDIIKNTNSTKDKNLLKEISNAYQKIEDSITSFITDIQRDKSDRYTKDVNDIMVEIANIYNNYKSIS